MSDMIWNGSYTLGNSQETKITAGTGIKVTTPAAGQIQISNDETVLYTGNGSSVVLSEVATNFERIRITWEHNFSNTTINHTVFEYQIPSNEFFGYGGRTGGSGFTWFIASWTLGSDKKTLSRTQSKYITITSSVGTPTDNANLYPIKVIGINRIAGGN
jgi:hypothetical protein